MGKLILFNKRALIVSYIMYTKYYKYLFIVIICQISILFNYIDKSYFSRKNIIHF